MSDAEHAFQELTKYLTHNGYTFVCPSPETQGRVVEKRKSNASTAEANNVADVFGWNLPISQKRLDTFLPQTLKETLIEANVLVPAQDNNYLRSTIRVSNFYPPEIPHPDQTATPLYYIHSSFPATSDSVFFGPDTYLFTSFLRHATHHFEKAPATIIDVCCGSGAGAIHMARTFPQARVLGLDLNPQALKYGAVNARLAGTTVELLESNLYASIPSSLHDSGGVDLIVSNPPYIASSADGKDLPMYADGGANFGLDISMRIVEEGRDILSGKGMLMIYTGVAIPLADPGRDPFLERIRKVEGVELVQYTILHPDMWPEEIGRGAYAEVGRIQAVGAVLKRRDVV